MLQRATQIIKKHSFEIYSIYTSKEHTLIYTAGKVGSSSIYLSLKPHLKHKVYFAHRLLQNNIDKYRKHFIDFSKQPPFQKMGFLLLNNVINKNKPIKIITAVRSPIDRTVSAFFQNYNMYAKHKTFDEKHICKCIEEFFPIEFTVNWWADEFIKSTKIDIYNEGFNKQKKHQTYQQANIEALVFRADLPDVKKEKIIQEFLSLPHFKIERHNITSSKQTAAIYSAVKKSGYFSDAYIEKMLNVKSTRAFFNSTEIEAMKEKWSKKT